MGDYRSDSGELGTEEYMFSAIANSPFLRHSEPLPHIVT